ncbi:MAG: DUF975 family protein [Eubacteriales bacterium]|nr:DUF975 family protein [Eubacteriales bacterium]
MGTHPFTAGQLHGQAYEILKKRYLWCIAMAGLVYLLSSVAGAIAGALGSAVVMPLQLATPLLSTLGEDGLWMLMGMIPLFVLVWALYEAVVLGAAALGAAVGYGAISPTFQIIDGQQPDIKTCFADAGKQWKRLLGTAGWVMLWTFLWSLLFVVPGVVKSYEYALTPYLMQEYPKMPIREAMKLSMRLTQGYKGRLFLIDLMMWGWGLVSLLLVCTVVVPLAATVLFITPMSLLMRGLAYRSIMEYAREHDMLRDVQAYL